MTLTTTISLVTVFTQRQKHQLFQTCCFPLKLELKGLARITMILTGASLLCRAFAAGGTGTLHKVDCIVKRALNENIKATSEDINKVGKSQQRIGLPNKHLCSFKHKPVSVHLRSLHSRLLFLKNNL